jgi:hypothetical protein
VNDQISTILKDHVADVDVPRLDIAATLRTAHQKRTRHRVRRGVVVAAMVGAAATGIATLPGATRTDDPAFSAAAATAAYRSGGAFALGSTLYFGNSQEYAVDLGDPIRTVHYVDGGVVVGTGKDEWVDGDGDSKFSLVSTSGEIQPLDIDNARFIGTDIESSFVSYPSKVSGDTWEIVVRDAEANKEVARVSVGDEFSFENTDLPYTQLDGDIVYVDAIETSGKNRMLQLAVNWRDGTVEPTDSLTGEFVGAINGGRAAISSDFGEDGAVRDIVTGRDLLTIPAPKNSKDDGFAGAVLSLDGRYAVLYSSRETKDGVTTIE